jgi:hypothetical protein
MTTPGELFADGRTCALAVAGSRDLARSAAKHPELFPEESFDAGLYLSLALAGAFGSPWATADALRAVNRSSLLVFAVDRLIDQEAAGQEDITTLVTECLAVAAGAAPRSPAGGFLADLRGELAGTAGFPALEAAWRAQLERMLTAMAREWEWSRARQAPTPERYLANADSCGAGFISVSHWIYTGQAGGPGDLDRLRPASDMVQRYLRLLNDLATHRRERSFGDLNAFTLGMTRDEVTTRLAELAREAADLIEPLRNVHPRAAEYLWWQIHYSAGFYELTDFWAGTQS